MDEHRWMPIIWLPFMVWFFLDPLWNGSGSLLQWIGNTIFGLVFIWLYLYSFSHPEPKRLYAAVAMLFMASLMIPTPQRSGLGAADLCDCFRRIHDQPRARDLVHWHRPRSARNLLALPSPASTGSGARWGCSSSWWESGITLAAIAHCAGEKLRKADAEIEHLAKVAERERIARDLHDLLGHTLSLITLKAELARKLVDRDPQRAKQEMLDVEQTSRAALADVREAISGYRGEGIAAELVRARKTLETAGITVDCEFDQLPLTPAQETVLALALREAVTNVVRHAQAQRCKRSAAAREGLCTLEIADNGRGADSSRRQRPARHARAPGGDWRIATAADQGRNPPRHSFAPRARRLRSAKLRA